MTSPAPAPSGRHEAPEPVAGGRPGHPLRSRLAAWATVATGSMSRRLGAGGGSVIGGRVGLAVDHGLLRSLTVGRTVALVSGTNGKTTTTRLLATAMGGPADVATSTAGANLPPGLAAALAASRPGLTAVLEVDEGYLPKVAAEVAPRVVVLLNLSRDQLDRVSEVRMVAARWRRAVETLDATVVANADDPLVVWAALPARAVRWVAAGQLWHADSAGCPQCGGRITFDAPPTGGLPSTPDRPAVSSPGDAGAVAEHPGDLVAGSWRCTGCSFARPRPDAELRDGHLVTASGLDLPVPVTLPGRCNLANAATAAVAAAELGVDEASALRAMAVVTDVEGRFAVVEHDGVRARLLLAKNPAGWVEILELLTGGADPVVVGINARVADGHDPSWLWDVDFERLAGRLVVATGERARDLAVRLRYAGVAHRTVPDTLAALHAAGADRVEYVGNYTAFQQTRHAVAGGGRPAAIPLAAPAPAPAVPTATRVASSESRLRIVVVHPDLLGTYGDGGNGRVLAARTAWRGQPVELVLVHAEDRLPETGDVYCLGGGEDGPQVEAAELLAGGGIARAVERGAAVLAVCAGFQVAGTSFPDATGAIRPGLGLLDVTTVKGTGRRAVGEVLAVPAEGRAAASQPPPLVVLETLTGFENHSGVTLLGAGVEPLAQVVTGVGNGDGTEGARRGRVVGTYLHGPVLARNPSLADLLLAFATGTPPAALDDTEERALRMERLAAVGWPGGRDSGPRGRAAPRAALARLVRTRRP